MSTPAPNRPRNILKRPIVRAGVFLVVLGLVAGYGSLRWTTGSARGVDLVGEVTAPLEKLTLRIANFNIQGGIGSDGKKDLARTASQLAGFDLIGLNEVRGGMFGSPANTAQDLAQRLSMAWLFAPSERRWWHDDFGNGVLSSVPVESWERLAFPTRQWRGYRNLVRLRVPHSGRVMTVLIAHIDRREDHDAQLKEAIAQFRAAPLPAVLMGDLNTTSDDPLMKDVLADSTITDALSKTPWPGRIDWIFSRGLDVVDSGIADKGASDHPLVWAEIRPKVEP